MSLSERRARWSGWRRRRSTRSARPATMPACGPPSSLSPEKQTRSAPAASAAAGVGSPSTSTSAPEPRSSTSGSVVAARDRGELLEPWLLGEADDAEVRLVHAQQQRRVRPDRALVVGGSGAVGRPDLDEAGAGAGEHVRDAEAVADLDQLAARDDDLATLGEGREREQHRRSVVVDDDRRLGAGQPPEQRREVVLARAARSGREVVLQVRVARPPPARARARPRRAAPGPGSCGRARRWR